jgi:hypothetical protein
MIPSTTERVHRNTSEELNEQLLRRIRDSVLQHAQAPAQALDRRLAELDHEWDTDRWMETISAALTLLGLALAAVSFWWLLLPAVVSVFVLSHALIGWDPVLPLYRRWGFRTSSEIDYERYVLKALRGDFQKLTRFHTADDRDAIARLEDEGGPVYTGPEVPDAADPQVVQEALEAVKK